MGKGEKALVLRAGLSEGLCAVVFGPQLSKRSQCRRSSPHAPLRGSGHTLSCQGSSQGRLAHRLVLVIKHCEPSHPS